MKKISKFILFIGLFGLLLLGNAVRVSCEAPLLRWGQSMQDVIKNQRISSYIEDDSKSFFSGKSSHVLMAEGIFLEYKSTFLYSFINDELVEYSVSIDVEEQKKIDTLYDKIKIFLNTRYHPYNGEFFCGIQDTFVDDQMKTCVLLIRDKKIVLYFIKFEAITSSKE